MRKALKLSVYKLTLAFPRTLKEPILPFCTDAIAYWQRYVFVVAAEVLSSTFSDGDGTVDFGIVLRSGDDG
jgi:hypothetical protein